MSLILILEVKLSLGTSYMFWRKKLQPRISVWTCTCLKAMLLPLFTWKMGIIKIVLNTWTNPLVSGLRGFWGCVCLRHLGHNQLFSGNRNAKGTFSSVGVVQGQLGGHLHDLCHLLQRIGIKYQHFSSIEYFQKKTLN